MNKRKIKIRKIPVTMVLFIPMALIYTLGICKYKKETNKRWNEFVEKGIKDLITLEHDICYEDEDDENDAVVFNDCD